MSSVIGQGAEAAVPAGPPAGLAHLQSLAARLQEGELGRIAAEM